MWKYVLAPRRPSFAPTSGVAPGTFSGTALSLAAHAALLAATVGRAGPRVGGPAPDARGSAPRERLLWVGIGTGAPGRRGRGRPDGRPPIAYVVPGSGRLRFRAAGAAGGAGGPGGAGDGTLGGTPLLRDLPPAPAERDRTRRDARRLPALPAAALAEAEAAVLVAGAIAAVPDLARPASVSRPEDFAPPPGRPTLLAELLVQTGSVTSAAGGGLHLGEVPVPFMTNPAPAYPPALARAGVGGRVVVEFRVDSTGAVDGGSLRVVQSDDARFVDAVRGVLPRLRFLPAQSGDHAVAMTVRQPFLFTVRAGG